MTQCIVVANLWILLYGFLMRRLVKYEFSWAHLLANYLLANNMTKITFLILEIGLWEFMARQTRTLLY